MKTAVRKQKGRRLQVTLAELLACKFKLTIEAVPPTQPVRRKNGAHWVSEMSSPDLRVRRSGESGADVALLSKNAQEKVSLDSLPVLWECKNVEAWTFDGSFWLTGDVKYVSGILKEMQEKALNQFTRPVLVLGKNRWPPLAVWIANEGHMRLLSPRAAILKSPVGGWTVTTLESFTSLLGL